MRKSHQGREGRWSKVSMLVSKPGAGQSLLVKALRGAEGVCVCGAGAVLFFPPALPLMSYCNPPMSFLKLVSREQGSILGEDRSIKT